LARSAGKAIVINNQGSGARLPESDREDMEIYLEKVNQLLPVLGVDLLVPPATKEGDGREQRVLCCEIKGLQARGQRSADGFIVLKGSHAVLEERASTKKYPWPHNMREVLIQEGALRTESDHLAFTRDTEFSSPSAAEAVIHGGHANGLTAWKDEQGKTLKEIESA